MGPEFPAPDAFIDRFFPMGTVARAPHTGDEAWTRIILDSLGNGHNEHGFRADPLVGERGALNILFVGCSNTAGLGSAYEETFAYLLTRRFEEQYRVPVRNWNLGYAGSSIDFATRTLANALDVLRPEIAFIVFTALDRRDYFTARGRFGRFHISTYHAYLHGRKDVCSPQVAEEMSRFYEIGNVFDDTANAYQNFKFAEAELEGSGAMWGWSTVWSNDTRSFFADARARGLVSSDRYLGIDFERIDINEHFGQPGPQSHRAFANSLWDWLHTQYGARIGTIVENYRSRGAGTLGGRNTHADG